MKRSINIHGIETKGKNENARPTFALIPDAINVLVNQKDKLKEYNIESEYVFPNEYGEPVSQSTYYKRWTRYRDAAGISGVSPYELRHTFVSIVKKLPEGLIKPIVGHSINMDTYGTYGHEVYGELEVTASLIHEQFSKLIK